MTTAVATRLKELRAEQKRAEREERRIADARLAERARIEVAAAERAEQKRKDAERADAVEAELRARAPYAVVYAGGREIRIDLGAPDVVGRQFAATALNRVAMVAATKFSERVAKSRSMLAAQPEEEWLLPMLDASHGLLYARNRNLVGIKTIGS
jgi:hypothetical protein